MNDGEQIRVCSRHSDYVAPLIFTFAFPGAEYWCPYCGYTSGIFGAGEQVEATPELVARAEAYQRASTKWLGARGGKFGGGKRKIDGVLYGYHDFPDTERRVIDDVIDHGWTYEVRVEDLGIPPMKEPRPTMTCDGCGKTVEAFQSPSGEWGKPPHWYERTDKDGTQQACSRECIEIVGLRTGKSTLIAPW